MYLASMPLHRNHIDKGDRRTSGHDASHDATSWCNLMQPVDESADRYVADSCSSSLSYETMHNCCVITAYMATQVSYPRLACLFSLDTVLDSAFATKPYLSRCDFVVRHTGIIPSLLHRDADGVALSLVQHGGGGRTRVECHHTCSTCVYICFHTLLPYIYDYPIYCYHMSLSHILIPCIGVQN